MKFTYKDNTYHFPASLAEITLGQRIGFYEQFGKALEERAIAIDKMTDEFDKEAESSIWHLDMAACTLAFYTGIPVEEIKSSVDMADLLHIYNTDMRQLHDQEQAIELQQSYEWNGEVWVIAAPELTPVSTMTLIEFITAKEAVRQLHAVGKGKWESLPYLCAAYLRKKGEEFDEAFTIEGSDRMKLMLELPLNIALAVAFFLSGTLSIYTTISLSLERESQKDSVPPSTLISGDG